MRMELVSTFALGAPARPRRGIGMEALAGDQTPAGAAEEVVYLDASALARRSPVRPCFAADQHPRSAHPLSLDHTRYLATVFVTD